MTALIVDDELDIGLMLSRILEKEVVSAQHVDRITKALEILAEKKVFDFYFLDLNLPDGTGFDLVPLIKKQQPEAAIYFISAYDGVFEKNKAAELEVNGFIKKPFTKSDILSAINCLR
ncbi:MAG: response regulator [Bacteroidota bacterium]